MTEPVSREDLEAARDAIIARLDAMGHEQTEHFEGFRQQQSAEHGSLFSKLTYITEILVWVKTQWARFSRPSDQPPQEKSPFK